jgi:apolipoprotein N-acyltransferase
LFLYGYLTGCVFFLATCSWIYGVMRLYGRLSVAEAAGVLLLFALAAATFFGLFSLLLGQLARRSKLGAVLAAPFVWVALEWLRAQVPFGGFPWNLVGYAVAPVPGWIQLAAYTGIYGVSFLVVAVNALVALAWRRPSRLHLGTLLVVAVALGGTAWRGSRLAEVPTTEQAVLVQTNLPQSLAWDPEWPRTRADEFGRIEELTRQAAQREAATAPGLVVWPEVPVSLAFHHDPALRGRLLGLAQATRSYLVVGTIDYQVDPEDGRLHPRNSAVLVGPQGEFIGQYDKIRLVPFGEYVPMASLLSFARKLVAEVSDFRPGTTPVVLPAGSDRLGLFICYEAIFPGLVREFVAGGAEVLVNLSNDGWFGHSAAAAQHLNMARMRAVETRRFLLRATNTGVTTIIDPYGRLVSRAAEHERVALVGGYAPWSVKSWYVLYGDWFSALCALISGLALGRELWVEATEGWEDENQRGTRARV